jgi:hypothetical protein
MSVTSEEYIKSRLEDQITWYSKKSASNQRMYKRLQLITIIASSSIPFLTAYASEFYSIEIVVGLIGVSIAAITSVNGLYKYQENWIAYRSTSESLKHQKYLYLTGTEPYHDEQAFNMLVQNVEMLISRENSTWSKQMDKPQQKNTVVAPAPVVH